MGGDCAECADDCTGSADGVDGGKDAVHEDGGRPREGSAGEDQVGGNVDGAVDDPWCDRVQLGWGVAQEHVDP